MSSLKSALCLGLLVCAGLLCRFSKGQAAPASVKPEDQILQLERDWLAADGKGDTVRLAGIVADDFMGGSSDGRLLSKQDIIPRGGSEGAFAGAATRDTNVRVFGDTAVLMGAIKTADSGEIRVTMVCQKRLNGWQMIAAQLSHP
jgi:Domain of unknown function (DUF4440)